MSATAPPAPAPASRVWFVDIVRLLASLQMVNGHTIDAVILPALKSGPIFDQYNWGRGLVSVGFLMVSGIAFSISTLARFDRHRANPAAIRARFRRALVVIAAGYFLGFPWGASSPEPAQASLAWTYFFSVGILHSIGAALLVLETLTLMARSATQVVWAAGLLAILAFALAPLADATLAPGQSHVFLNWISHKGGSPFPLLPWSGNVFAGVVIGSLALPRGGQTPHPIVWSRLAMLAGGTWLLSAVLRAVPWSLVTAATHPSARPAFVVANLAAVLLVTLVLSVVVAPVQTLPRVLRTIAGETLAIYVFHLVVLFGFDVRLARRIGPTLELPQALAFAAFMIALTTTFALTWHRVKAWGRDHRRIWLALLCLLVAAGEARASDTAPIVGHITSVALGEVRDYSVRLPTSYARDSRRRFPVVYVLDGPPLDGHTAEGATQLADRGLAPEIIVVGIPNMQRGGRARDFLPPWLSFRRPDGRPFTGGADRFLKFLRDELVPRIERDYRTSAPRLLVGHSLGAIFVCYSLAAAPSFFDGRFAHSPAIWRDEDAVVADVDRTLAASRSLAGFFYLSVGEKEGTGMGHAFEKLRAVLTRRAAAAGLRWRADITPGAAHETNVRLATPSALRAYFDSAKAVRPD